MIYNNYAVIYTKAINFSPKKKTRINHMTTVQQVICHGRPQDGGTALCPPRMRVTL